ncbi:MAG: hypothetical protein U0136_07595 [Bdellovibrionota bacterium]
MKRRAPALRQLIAKIEAGRRRLALERPESFENYMRKLGRFAELCEAVPADG